MKTTKVLFMFAMILPALLLLAALGMALRTASFIKHSARAEGQIIEVKRTQMGTPVPTFSFSDASSLSHTQTVPFASSAFALKPGDKVAVVYDPSVPAQAMIDSFPTLWIRPVILAGIGLLLGGTLAGVAAVVSWRERRHGVRAV